MVIMAVTTMPYVTTSKRTKETLGAVPPSALGNTNSAPSSSTNCTNETTSRRDPIRRDGVSVRRAATPYTPNAGTNVAVRTRTPRRARLGSRDTAPAVQSRRGLPSRTWSSPSRPLSGVRGSPPGRPPTSSRRPSSRAPAGAYPSSETTWASATSSSGRGTSSGCRGRPSAKRSPALIREETAGSSGRFCRGAPAIRAGTAASVSHRKHLCDR